MNVCMKEGCQAEARWQIAGLIWARMTPPSRRTEKTAAKMLCSVIVCDEHKHDLTAHDLFSARPETRARIRQAFAAAGRAEPEFETIQLTQEPIIDKPISVEQWAKGGGQL